MSNVLLIIATRRILEQVYYLYHKRQAEGVCETTSDMPNSSKIERGNRCLHDTMRPNIMSLRRTWSLVAAAAVLILLADFRFSKPARCDSQRSERPIGSLWGRPWPSSTNQLEQPERDNLEEISSYSHNNRGGFYSPTTDTFGRRIEAPLKRIREKYLGDWRRLDRKADAPQPTTVWSQPDPRKTYSLPLNLGSLSLKGLLRNKPFSGGGSPDKGSSSSTKTSDTGSRRSSANGNHHSKRADQQQAPTNSTGQSVVVSSSSTQSHQSVANDQLADDEQGFWRNNPEQQQQQNLLDFGASQDMSNVSPNQRPIYQQQQAKGNLITLIRYMPVLMSVPAEQLVGPPPARLHFRPSTGGQVGATKGPEYSLDIATTTTPPTTSGGGGAYYGPIPLMYGGPVKQGNEQQSRPVNQLQHALSPSLAAPYDFDSETYATHYPSSSLSPSSQSSQVSGQPGLVLAHPPPLPLAGYQHFSQPPQPMSLHQVMASSSGATSKALSAYASRLMAMLRPSSLLSSIGQQQPAPHAFSHQPTSGQIYPLPSSGHHQLYLLTPAGSGGPDGPARPTSLLTSSGSVGRPMIALNPPPLKADDLLLNQASSKLSSSMRYASRPSSGFPERPWIHQHPNGLICIHHMVLPAKPQPSSGQPAVVQPFELSPQRLPSQQQQQIVLTLAEPLNSASSQQQQQPPPELDHSSFDYVATSSSLVESTKGHSEQEPTSSGRLSSPAHRLGKGKKQAKGGGGSFTSSSTSRQDRPKMGDRESEAIDRQMANQRASGAGSSTLDSSPSPETTSSASTPSGVSAASSTTTTTMASNSGPSSSSLISSKFTDPVQQYQHQQQQYKKRTRSESIIPFTIKDKIEAKPVASAAKKNSLPSKSHSFSSDQLTINGYPVVQYDEPEFEGELEQQTAAVVGKRNNIASNREEPQKPRETPSTGRRSNTSFLASKSSTRSKNTAGPSTSLLGKNIDYRKETTGYSGGAAAAAALRGSGNDLLSYTLPLLMASSSPGSSRRKSESADSKRTGGFTSTARPTTVAELIGAPSSAVSTSSTIDGQPVLLPSGLVGGGSSTGASATAAVELVVNSTLASSDPASSRASSVDVADDDHDERRQSEPAEVNHHHHPHGVPSNHLEQSHNNNAFDNNKLLTFADSSAEEFGRVSEALQMNPLDLIDLQNSRSNFELPSQLESLSMLFHGTGAAATNQDSLEQQSHELQPVYEQQQQQQPEGANKESGAEQTKTSGNHYYNNHATPARRQPKSKSIPTSTPTQASTVTTSPTTTTTITPKDTISSKASSSRRASPATTRSSAPISR